MTHREKLSALGKKNKNLDFEKKNSYNKPIKKVTRIDRIRSLIYLLKQDKKSNLLKFFLKRPIYYSFNLLKSYLKKTPYTQTEGLFFFKLKSFNDLEKKALDQNSIFVYGYSYCMKPKLCPSKRFTFECIRDKNNKICQKCLIFHQSGINQKDIILIIPDAYYIGIKLAQIMQKNPKKEIIYVIMTCNMCINMFADLSNMLNINGLSIELTGKVCRNFKSFLFAEEGRKSGITSIDNSVNKKIVKLLNYRKNFVSER